MDQYKHLIQDCMNGNRRSQNQLYKMFIGKMYALCLRYAKNRQEAEEIAQEGFTQVFRSLKNYSFNGSFEGWIRKIMVYSAIHHFRNKTKVLHISDFELFDLQSPNQESAYTYLGKKDLLKMIQNLPSGYRMVFNLYVFEGLKHREIAELLGITEGTSKSNLFDAKAILQKKIANSLKILKNY